MEDHPLLDCDLVWPSFALHLTRHQAAVIAEHPGHPVAEKLLEDTGITLPRWASMSALT